MGPKLCVTKDYSIFEMNEFNRAHHEDSTLETSMKEHGFIPGCPLFCVPSAIKGKVKIQKGHHRFYYAKKLGLPVWYVICKSDADIFDLENHPERWSVNDYLFARAQAGDKACMAAINYKKDHGVTAGAAISLVGGESAGSGNKSKAVKRGTFQQGNPKISKIVGQIVDVCHEKGITWAGTASFVKALSFAVQVPEFDPSVMIQRITLYPGNLNRRSNVSDYLAEIESLYNYGARGNRIPLKFLSEKAARHRQQTFGMENNVNSARRQE